MSDPIQANGPSEPMDTTSTSRAATPDAFQGVAGQRALPDTPARAPDSVPTTPITSITYARRSQSTSSSSNTRMRGVRESSTGSSTTTRGGKRKKVAKTFICTGYEGCELSFTRSEHLARHIRKHTGERPFECHCARRFSRLDNLRQHAQTVHANEDIPEGSLAVQGGRFKRSPKGPAPNRRAQPIRQGPVYHPSHRRNVHSMPANQMPPMYSYPDHRRAPSMQMVDPRGYPMSSYPQHEEPYYAHAPYTPPSNRSSGAFESHYSPANGSPSFSYANDRFPPRRQSISYAPSPFYGHASAGAPQLPPLHAGMRESYQSNNMFESPHSSAPAQFAQYPRREDSLASDPRRRTWHHRGEFNYMASGLQNVTNTPPEDPRERRYQEYNQAPVRDSNSVQLPPITSFDQAPPLSHRRPQSPMEMDAADRPMYYSPEQHYARYGPSMGNADGTRSHYAHEQQQQQQQFAPAQNLSQDFHRMEIRPDAAAAWANDVNQALDPRMRDSQDADAASMLASLREQRPKTST